jgi:hypothetical protein
MKKNQSIPLSDSRFHFWLFSISLAIFFVFGFNSQNKAQVTFTQTTDADFNRGFHDQVLVSGNNVYLSAQATDINNWLSTNDLPASLSGHQITTWRNNIYLSGGFNGTVNTNAIYRATFQSAGNTTWTSYSPLPDSVSDHAMVCTGEHMYVFGGRKAGIPADKIYYAPINSDGTPGTWAESSVNLPQPLWGHTAIYTNGYIYILGGSNSNIETTALNTVYFAKIAGIDGGLSPFTATTALPAARNNHSAILYNNNLVVIGGHDNSGTKSGTVYYADLNLDGTLNAWMTGTSLSVNISHHSSTCLNGLITVIGGEDTGGLSDKVYVALADDLPALTWSTSPDLLYEARKNGAAYAYNGQIIYAGGENISASPIHNTRYATVNLTADKVNHGSFLSYPFYQLGESRDMESLTYTITYNPIFNNYELLYRLAGSDQLWGNWIVMNQDNPAIIGQNKQYLQYMVRFDGTDDDNVLLHDMTLNISGYTQLSGSLNGMDTLKLADSPFWATGDISFTGGTHVVEAGVEILFSPNTGLEIGQANMSFEGTAAQPVVLTSYSAEQGLWNGVYFNTNSDNTVSSQLEYVVIEKAGNGTRNANIYCENTNEPMITHCSFNLADGNGMRLNNADLSLEFVTLSDNTASGLYLQNSSPSLANSELLSNGYAGLFYADLNSNPNFFDCEINDNYFGIYYPSPNYSFPVISGITTYNNDISGIAVAGGTISSDQTWPFNPLGYAIVGDVVIAKINSHARLTIEPGNTLYFDTLVNLQIGQYVYYNQHYGGELYAIGKPDSLITFTSINGEPGGWEGIYFHYNSDNFGSVSELNYCVIENGDAYNIRCEQTLQPRIDHCTITDALSQNIYVQDPNSVPHITESTTTVYVNGGTQSINKTWYNFGNGEYVVLNDIIVGKQNDRVRLEIEPGNTIKVDTSAMIQIGNYVYYNQEYGGELWAEGNADSIITFTSHNGLSGGWDGIFFHYNSDSFGSTSSLKYCTIEKGKNFNIKSDGSAEPRIDHCTITNSEGYDIYATAPNHVQHITNSQSTVFVGAGTQSINKTWYNYGGDYIIVGDIVVAKQNDTVRLTIEPGITIKTDTNCQIKVAQYVYYNQNYGGEIFAIGKSDSLITFTSRNGLQGGWDGIYFHDFSDSFNSKSYLKYCTIENGNAFNVYCENTVQPHIDSCTIINSDGYDIYALNPNSVPHVTATNSTIYIGAGTQSIHKTWYNFGGEYILNGDVIIGKQNTYCTLTIQPGITIKSDSSVTLQVGNYIHYNQNYGGELIAEGNPDSLILFESLNPITDKWDGIYFHELADNYGGRSSLKYCIIDNATSNNLYCNATSNIDLDHVTFTGSGQSGVRLNNSSPYFKLCRFINNDSIGIVLTGSSNPVIGDTLGLGCDIYGNGDFGIYNNTSNNILARYNFWNTTDSTSIAARVFDHYDASNWGIVYFMPVVNQSYFDNLPPEAFDLISLTNGAVTSDQHPDFSWQEPIEPDGDPLSYYFSYTDDETWTTSIISTQVTGDPVFTIPETLTGGKWYWWKVRATDGFLSKYCNQVWSFAVSLPPTIPQPIVPSNATLMHETDFLVWLTSTDPDDGDQVSHYHLQVDDDPAFGSPEIDTSGITLMGKATSISIQLQDLPGYLALENKNYYWRVSAIDGFGVESNFSDGSNYFLYLLKTSLKVMLEGAYEGPSMNTTLHGKSLVPLAQPYNQPPWNYMTYEGVPAIPGSDIVDWILLELRSTTGNASTASSDKMIYRKAAFLTSNGAVIDLDGSPTFECPVSFDDHVFLVVYHRNHLPVISSTELTPSAGLYYYDFTSDAGQVFGGMAGYTELSPGTWGMSCGDMNNDGTIDSIDVDGSWAAEAGNKGYHNGDVNMDGEVENPDKNDYWWMNAGKTSGVPDW